MYELVEYLKKNGSGDKYLNIKRDSTLNKLVLDMVMKALEDAGLKIDEFTNAYMKATYNNTCSAIVYILYLNGYEYAIRDDSIVNGFVLAYYKNTKFRRSYFYFHKIVQNPQKYKEKLINFSKEVFEYLHVVKRNYDIYYKIVNSLNTEKTEHTKVIYSDKFIDVCIDLDDNIDEDKIEKLCKVIDEFRSEIEKVIKDEH